ncbi:sodium/hydrogen exchanger 10-like isoform X11 [Mauremys reevesii]|uniref:sodium/hydrogen exchanger 10-like isoform X11 n=1 Tax=Mauremys reevesii TaxID=260615 RepID=UPI00193FEB94|nr:sodium/hydrogen exchanger 10-like isoform X11 [Mauremys reevesii]
MSAINSSFVWVTPSLPQGPLGRTYLVEAKFHGHYHIIGTRRPFFVLLVFVSCAVGALLRTILKKSHIPITVILSLIGVLLGVVGYFVKEFRVLTEYVAEIDPILFLHMFTPVIIFTAAFEMDFYLFRKSFWQIFLLSVPGFLLNCTLIGLLTYKINKYNWNWHMSMLFGVIVSTTDPILSVASVKNIGLSKIIINLIKGESLFSDATSAIVFELYSDLVSDPHTEVAKEIIIKLVLKFFASTIFGFLSSRIVKYWLSHVFNDGLTEVILSFSMAYLIFFIGLCNITLPKRMAMYSAVQRIKEMEANTCSILKLDRFLADANWTLIEEAIKIDCPYKFDIEEASQIVRTLKCPDCNTDISDETTPQQIADILEEARLRLLTAQIASYQKQYHTGMLNQDAAQILIGAAESYVDIKGKFMNIHEVKTYWESKGLLVSFKKLLSDWVYNVKDEKSKPSRNKILKLCHHIVFMNEFEYTSYIITLLNLIPILIDFTHLDETYIKQLKICNYYFISLYILEASLKALAMGKAYIFHHWNQFELVIIIVGLIDIMIINIFKPLHPTYHMIKTIRVFRIIRLIRVTRLLKLVIPRLINLLEKQINKQLNVRYDIAKGYVQGEEDTKYLIEQISCHETISKEINKIMEKNKQDGMKELGLMQRDNPDIVTAVKTKQVVQTVLNAATETLKVLISSGIVDKNEEAKLQKMILQKKTNLGTLPSTIAPPTAEELLHSISWLENEKKQIEFIQKRARILCYDYGDIICEEHEMPEGIHLIISGMTKLCGSSPSYGVANDVYELRNPKWVPYTDYLISGAIIGELNCLTKQEMEYTVTCETAVQTCFISMNDLSEAFDEFLECPSLKYKIWFKLALDITIKAFKEKLAYQDCSYKMCTKLPNVYVMDVPSYKKCDIYDGTMDDVILVHGSVQDCQIQQPYFAPCILPKTCHEVLGTAPVTKLLIVQTTTTMKRKSTSRCSNTCQYHSYGRRQATFGNAEETDGSSRHSPHSDSVQGETAMTSTEGAARMVYTPTAVSE